MSALPVTVLIFTYSEYGQANVNIATAYELALAGVNVYIASFASLKSRVLRLQELVARHASRESDKLTGSISFVECQGMTSWSEAAIKCGVKDANFSHPHGVLGALECYSIIDIAWVPWKPEEYMAAIESCKGIVTTIKPNVVAMDVAFRPAADACKLLGQKFMIISPGAIKELVELSQPYLAALWKYPILSSGFPFPLKWWQVPLNIFLRIWLGITLLTSMRMRRFQAVRQPHGFKYLVGDQPNLLYRGVTYICAAFTEAEYPFAIIPEQLLMCGPILMPFDPLEESDPALLKWLDNGPTVMVNLGTLVVSDLNVAKEIAGAYRILLDYHERKGTRNIQVLWKARTSQDVQTALNSIIGKELKEGRIKVVSWMDAEPISVLQHPNVICTAHHGGANSFHEGIWSGLPHVVLPVWYDTYDFARRVEFLNIGIFGSKTCAPGVRAEEFGDALVRVTGDTKEAAKFRASAKRLKEVCRAKGSGRKLSAMAILKEAGVST